MADITIPVIGGASKRLKDMGDGTHAEVVATALSLDGVQIEGGGLTPAESAALQAVATESAQLQQIVQETAIRIAVEAVAAVIAGGRLKVDASGVTQPVSAAALPLPAGAATAAAQATQIAAEQAISTVLGAPNDAAPADTSAAGTVPAWLRWLARGIGAPSDAAATSGTGVIGLLRALLARWPSALVAGRVPVDASGVTVTADPSAGVLQASAAFDCTNTGTVQVLDVSAYRQASVQLAGTWTGTVTFQGSNDSTNGTDGAWFSVSAMSAGSLTSAPVSTATANGLWLLGTGYRWLRVQVTTVGTGSVTAYVALDTVPGPTIAQGGSSGITGTVTVAGGATTSANTIVGCHSTPSKVISAATTNATSLAASAAVLGACSGYNASASIRYLKLFNKASAPTLGTDTPVQTVTLAPNAPFVVPLPALGARFSTGIAYAITGGQADNDTTAIGAGEVVVNFIR